MSIHIELKPNGLGYMIHKAKCPNCKAEFVFRIGYSTTKPTKYAVYDIIGDGMQDSKDKDVVRCKICESSFRFELVDKALSIAGPFG